MTWILPDILSLAQYLTFLNKPDHFASNIMRCSYCNLSTLWRHGCYPRKADRLSTVGQSLNPIYIQRFYCPFCQKTCSVLPECIPPRRWYLWEVQQVAFLLLLSGCSLRQTAKQVIPTRSTISRWNKRFCEQFLKHKNTLVNHFIDLGRTNGFVEFWKVCLGVISLSSAMRLCHAAGVLIP